MSGLEVAACVASIISAFGTGLDVFRKIRAKRRARKLKRSQQSLQNELQIQQSLERSPLEIQAEYDRYFSSLGERFAAGDRMLLSSAQWHDVLTDNSCCSLISRPYTSRPQLWDNADSLRLTHLRLPYQPCYQLTLDALKLVEDRYSSCPWTLESKTP